MTPEEVFEQLRDVHLPEVDAPTVGGMDPRPLIVFAVFVAVLWIARLWRRNHTKMARLETDASSPPSDQRDQIVRAVRQGAMRNPAVSVPRAAFAEPSEVTEACVHDLRTWAIRRIG
ncbi:MAG: hypothetical protein AAF557_16605 [Pseudomonadota bacterium]